MNRIKDYTGFAAWFAGLGYITLWPVASPDLGGKPFGASIVCGQDGALSLMMNLLCNSAHPLRLPPALHAIGFLSAVFVTVRLLIYAVKRSRRVVSSGAQDKSDPAARVAVAIEPPPRKWVRPLRTVKPRTHFGLRGMPH